MATEYWMNKDNVTTPQGEVDLIFQTVDFTLAENGRLPQTGKEYCDFEEARLMTEILVTIMQQNSTSLNTTTIVRIKKISDGLEKAYEVARSQASLKIKTL
jgi:hypothetical protein